MNCPNCGAPVTGRVCDYCGTVHAKESEQVTIVDDYDYTIIRDWDGIEVYRVRNIPTVKLVVGE